MEQAELLAFAAALLDRLAIRYAIVGSFASAAWGEPRFTQDIDIAVQLPEEQLDPLLAELPNSQFYVSRSAALDGIRLGRTFNAIHISSGNKIDFMVLGDSAWARAQMERRRQLEIAPGVLAFVASPDDVIIGKLVYFREGGSDKHLRDIAGMLRISRADVDRNYVGRGRNSWPSTTYGRKSCEPSMATKWSDSSSFKMRAREPPACRCGAPDCEHCGAAPHLAAKPLAARCPAVCSAGIMGLLLDDRRHAAVPVRKRPMSRLSISALTLAIAVSCALEARHAAAQVYIGRGRGVIVNAPGVTVRVGPFGAGVGVYPWRAQPVAPATVASSRPPQPPLPSADELARMSDIDLLNGLVALSARLDADLGRFTSAESWRRHLRLPDDALPPATDGQVVVGRQALVQTLQRFDSAAANPAYRQISGVPSFRAVRAALAEAVRRFGAKPTSDEAGLEEKAPGSSSAEELPAPPPSLAPPRNAPESERSILFQ